MSFTRVQSTTATASGASTISATFASSVTAGNLVVVGIAAYHTNTATSGTETLSDNKSNSYSAPIGQSVTHLSFAVKAAVQYTQVATGGTSFQVTYTPPFTPSGLAICITEYSFSGTLSVNATSSSTGIAGTSLTSGNMTTSASTLLVGMGATLNSAQTWTVGSGFNSLLTNSGGSGAVAACCEDELNVASGTVAATMTSSTSDYWTCVGAAFSAVTPVGTMAVTERHDTFAGSGGFSDIGSMANTEAHDTFAASVKFTTPGTLSKTEAHDTFSGSARFLAPSSMAKTEAHDVFAASVAFNSNATAAIVEAHDVFRTASVDIATMAKTEAGDVFAGSAAFKSNATAPIVETHDHFAAFAKVSPFLQAREHGDTFAGSATATSCIGTIAVTEGHDVFAANGGFTFDVVAHLAPTEHGDIFASAGTESSSATMAKTEHGDIFAGSTSVVAQATLGPTEHGDIFHGGYESVRYHVYSNTGFGDPINYNAAIADTSGLTYTSGALHYPGTWSFGVRAYWAISKLEEQNVDCVVTIVLDASGLDITNQPVAPFGLRGFPLAAGAIKIEWTQPPTIASKKPTGFHVYIGTTGAPNYGTVVATVLENTGINNAFSATIPSLIDGTTYKIGVRAYNMTAEEKNLSFVSVVADATGPSAVIDLTATATA